MDGGGLTSFIATPVRAPDALRDLRAWLIWRLEPSTEAGKKDRKVPYYVNGKRRSGQQGSPDDRAALASYEEAKVACRQRGFTGVGLALLPELGIVALDFDGCVKGGQVDPEVEKLVAGTYAEFSPSGFGVRAFMCGSLTSKKSLGKNWAYGFEVFGDSGFVTFTGELLDSCRMLSAENIVAPLSEVVRAFCEHRFGRGYSSLSVDVEGSLGRGLTLREITGETISDLRSALAALKLGRAEEYEPWINVGHALKSLEEVGFGAVAVDMWHEFSARSQRYSEYEADEKWSGFHPAKITYRSIFQWAQEDGWKNPRSAEVLKAGNSEDYARLEDRTDTGNANLLIRLTQGNLRYVPERRLWLWWDGARWIADEFDSNAHAAAQEVARHYHTEAADLKKQEKRSSLSEDERQRISKAAGSVDKWAAHCRNKRAMDCMLSLAAKDTRVLVPVERLDRDPWLLGVANGVVDLRTGKLRDAARDEYVTKRSPVAFYPDANAPRWNLFINEITAAPGPVSFFPDGVVDPTSVYRFKPRPELAAYLQRALGYSLTGSTAEHKMLLAIGAGSNGKNVLLDTVQEILGDYCRTIPPEALMAIRHDADAERPSPTAATLAGARLAVSSESKDGQRLDVALIKRHTGGGFLTARLMRENTFRFPITHKLLLMTNHKPSLDHLDEAMRGRLHLIPFDRQWNRPGHPERDPTLPDGDKELMDKLRDEASGILAWLIEGAVAYFREGLEPPSEVADMTRTYFAELDPVGRWLERYARCDPSNGTGAADLFRDFEVWRRDEDTGNGQGPGTQTAFGYALASRNVSKKHTKTGARYGLKLKTVTGDE